MKRHITIAETAAQLNISYRSMPFLTHDCLELCKFMASCKPYIMKETPANLTITRNEVYVQHSEPEHK